MSVIWTGARRSARAGAQAAESAADDHDAMLVLAGVGGNHVSRNPYSRQRLALRLRSERQRREADQEDRAHRHRRVALHQR